MNERPPRLSTFARRILSALRDIGNALHEQNKAAAEADNRTEMKQSVGPEVHVNVHLPPEVKTEESKAETSEKRRDRTYQRCSVWISGLTFIAVVIYAGLAYLQWREMINATDASADAVHEARRSRGQAEKALAATIKQFDLDQRAWIIFPHKYGLVDFVANGPITYSVGFLNVGKTPADKVQAIVRAEIVASRNEPSLSYEPGTSNIFQSGEMVPNDDEPPKKLEARAKHIPIVVSAERLRGIQLGDEYVAIYGQMTYRDLAGDHWMRFCAEVNTVEPQKEQQAPQKCEQYNSSGDGKAPPTIQ